MMGRILVVDDEAGVLASIEKILVGRGHQVHTARAAEPAIARIAEEDPDVVLMDIRLPGMSGLEAFRRIRDMRPKLPVIVMTGYGSTDSAIEATKLGAFEYVVKPFDPMVLLQTIDQALECVRLMKGQVSLARMPEPPADDAIIGETAPMQEVYKAIGRVAETNATVLIRGETGTGKELVARAIYQHSRRRAAPMLLINCAAVPETLLESEFFGHEKGAFTGAGSRRIGKLEQAEGGTVFLDEIGDIPPGIQVKILRVLQEKRFERVGGNETIGVDIRLIAATNRDLERAMAEGRFREDLYHRLNVVTIQVPPLRERKDDIPLLTNYFLERIARQSQTERTNLTAEALHELRAHDWPGNVRELGHCLQRAVLFSRGYPVQAEDVRRSMERSGEEKRSAVSGEADLRRLVSQYLSESPADSAHRTYLELVDKTLVFEALRRTGGNQTHAAKLLGLTRPTLQGKMLRYGIRRVSSVREE